MSQRAPHPPHSGGLLRFITAGNVDDGKSTLIGRLLYDAKSLFADQLDAVALASARRGRVGVDLSLLTDGLEDERAQGITIDVAYRYFATPRRKFIIGDSPGHEQYTRNMVTAASTADAAVILVDAREGVRPQTRRHATLAALVGVETLVFAVNKMDLVGYDEARYAALAAELQALAADIATHYGARAAHVIPLSALTGANVVQREADNAADPMRWHRGPTLLALLETLPATARDGPDAPFRFPVQGVVRPGADRGADEWHDFRGYTRRIESGRIAVGDRVTVLPAGRATTVSGLSLGGSALVAAEAPASVQVELADDLDVARGDWIVSGTLPAVTRAFSAHLCWLGDAGLVPRTRAWLKHGTRTVKAIVESIDERLDIHTLAAGGDAAALHPNDIGRVSIRLAHPLPVEPYRASRIAGSFVLIDEVTHDTVGAGMIFERGSAAVG